MRSRRPTGLLLVSLAFVTLVHWLWPIFADPDTSPLVLFPTLTRYLPYQQHYEEGFGEDFSLKPSVDIKDTTASRTSPHRSSSVVVKLSSEHPVTTKWESNIGLDAQTMPDNTDPALPLHTHHPTSAPDAIRSHPPRLPSPTMPSFVKWTTSSPLVVVCSGPCKWVHKVAQRDVPVVECLKKKPNTTSFATSTDAVCSLPGNVGREASSYLMFIVNSYYHLPQRILFLHGHEKSWHQRPATPEYWPATLRYAWEAKSFQGMNNFMISTRPGGGNGKPWDWKNGGHDGEAQRFKRQWDDVVEPLIHMDCPQEISCDGSSQFVVPRESILRFPLEVYASILVFCVPIDAWNPTFNVSSIPVRTSNRGTSKKCAFFMEWIWHILFGEGAVVTPKTLHNIKYN